MFTKFIAFTAAALLAITSACPSALSLIEQAEGYRPCMYKDSMGIKTICYGFNLQKGDAQQEVEAVGGNYQDLLNGGCLSQSQCTQLLQDDVNTAASEENSIFGSQCQCITNVLTDMTYNLGEGGMRSFTTFNSYIEQHNWSAAASDIRGTLWCRQVGSRCTRDAGIIAAGC
mmetsp:Transcript_58894/g.81727  ORF Transcript_58894/g.81727 Transcript_58894/m.81727 type:complete len:172 (+) Transcript_58894:27-542(+)